GKSIYIQVIGTRTNMIFWSVALLIGLGTALYISRAARLARAEAVDLVAEARARDLAVYKDQLKEVDRDLSRGVLDVSQAEQARTEVARRILAVDRARSAAPALAGTDAAWVVPVLAGITVLGAIGSYAFIGAPGYGDMPLERRIEAAAERAKERPSLTELILEDPAPEETTGQLAELIAQLRTALAERPDDVEGHRLLARNEAALGRYNAAIAAQTRVIDLLGAQTTAGDVMGLAELQLAVGAGYVSPEAEASLRRVLTLDPNHSEARYGMGLYYAQVGRPDAAFRLWNPLLAEGPEQAPWIAPIRLNIEEIARRAGVPRYRQPTPVRGPSADDIAAAAELSSEAQREMIVAMVAGLSARLADEGGPPEEWMRLIQAYAVLGDQTAAKAVFSEASQVFSGMPEAGLALRQLGAELDLLDAAQ
ncbi:MAG: c-type cytochrome biogenesis protein CcmI, partial [Pseudomonadota bacterium]